MVIGMADGLTVLFALAAGVAEIAAGTIAMGLGGYLAAKSDADRKEITAIFSDYGISDEESRPVLEALERNPIAWRDFMMKFELGLEEPDPKRDSTRSIHVDDTSSRQALLASAGVTLLALGIFWDCAPGLRRFREVAFYESSRWGRVSHRQIGYLTLCGAPAKLASSLGERSDHDAMRSATHGSALTLTAGVDLASICFQYCEDWPPAHPCCALHPQFLLSLLDVLV